MILGDDLPKIRRFLRDPDANIWSDEFLISLWNQVQQDIAHRAYVLEDIAAIRIPGVAQFSYMHDWEYRHLPAEQTRYYQCLNQHDEKVFCHRWEPQQVAQITVDVSDYGVHFTHPWEAFMSEVPGEVARFRFPQNFNRLKFIAYDEEPLEYSRRKDIQNLDPSYVTASGEPYCYYPYDDTENSFVLYPRPSTAFVNELEGEGQALFADGDTEDLSEGTIATRTGSSDTTLVGMAVDIVDVADNLFMVYEVSPADIEAASDEPQIPVFLRKYVWFGVLAKAYGGNNDGKIKSLADYWGVRYEIGLKMIRQYISNRLRDRDYRLSSGPKVGRRHRHPRLPDSYPNVGP